MGGSANAGVVLRRSGMFCKFCGGLFACPHFGIPLGICLVSKKGKAQAVERVRLGDAKAVTGREAEHRSGASLAEIISLRLCMDMGLYSFGTEAQLA